MNVYVTILCIILFQIVNTNLPKKEKYYYLYWYFDILILIDHDDQMWYDSIHINVHYRFKYITPMWMI